MILPGTTDHLPHCLITRTIWELALSCLSIPEMVASPVRQQLRVGEIFLEEKSKIKVFEPFPMLSFG